LNAQHVLVAMEHLSKYISFTAPNVCSAIPTSIPFPFIGVIPNPGFCICKFISFVIQNIVKILLVAASIVKQVVDDTYEIATLGPRMEMLGFEYSRATHKNMQAFAKWRHTALMNINTKILEQHTSMRTHLQDRHLAMETNIGQDIVDTQNILGQKITDAQNEAGQGLTNALNYVASQHNEVVEFIENKFSTNVCKVYQATGGLCQTFIGPLEEGKKHAPLEVSWPENQPSLTERLQDLETFGNKIKEEVKDITGVMDIKGDAAMKNIEAAEGKIDMAETKIEEINGSLDELQDMMSQLLKKME